MFGQDTGGTGLLGLLSGQQAVNLSSCPDIKPYAWDKNRATCTGRKNCQEEHLLISRHKPCLLIP
jgi:hypothetical protein